MPKPKKSRALKPKHEYRPVAAKPGHVECWACSVMQGVSVYPCRDDWGNLSHGAQRTFFKAHGICGRCGQVAGTYRTFCKCKGRCGCWSLHEREVEIPGQDGLFDEPERIVPRKRRGEIENPG